MNIFSRFGISEIDGELAEYTKLLSDDMQKKLCMWLQIQKGEADWNSENPPSGVVASIVGAIADPVYEEMKIESENEELKKLMNDVHSHSPELVGNDVCVGSSIIRPIFSNNKVQYEIIKNGFYIPTAYDMDGTLTGCVILKKIQDGKKQFMLVEKHSFDSPIHIVEESIYRIQNGNFRKASLEDCSQTEGMEEAYSWENVELPMIVEFRNPRQNTIDDSALPIALYGGHENLIEDCDRQYNEINWEQIAGRTRIFADEDLFRDYQGADGKRHKVFLPEALQKLVIKLHGNGTAEEKIQTHSPTLRTEQQISAYQQILREIENVCRIGKGTLSNLEEQIMTATQFKGGKAVLYNTVNTFESEFEKKYKHLAYIFAYMLSAYQSVPFNPDISIIYDDSDRKDATMEKQSDLMEVNAGLMQKWEYRMKHYGEDEETAKQNVPEQISGGFVF